ncbi:hypothetical protein STEG23_022953 [Scotinomys teguina]
MAKHIVSHISEKPVGECNSSTPQNLWRGLDTALHTEAPPPGNRASSPSSPQPVSESERERERERERKEEKRKEKREKEKERERERETCKRKEQEPNKDRNNSQKKSRLVFTDLQRRTLFAIFKENKRPSKEMQITISQQLGLELTTVSNFFMNARRRSLEKWQDDLSTGGSSSTSSTCTKA